MNSAILKSPGFLISAIAAIVGLLVSQGVILHGSTVDQVLAYVISLLGALGGHTVAAPAAQTTEATPPAAPPTGN